MPHGPAEERGMCSMDLLNELRALGVDVDDGVKRIMGNEKLYRKLLGSFVKMVESEPLDLDFDSGDFTAVTERVHAIKGTAGNLSITPVYEAYSQALGQLRGGQPEEAREVLRKVQPILEEILCCIKDSM